MRWGRPKSLSGLMLVGLALIAVPLLIAILTAVLQIRELADTGTKIVIQGVAGARASQALFGQIASLERTARLYEVLNDRKLVDLYRTQDERLSSTREQLQRLTTGDMRETLEELGRERNVHSTITHGFPHASTPPAGRSRKSRTRCLPQFCTVHRVAAKHNGGAGGRHQGGATSASRIWASRTRKGGYYLNEGVVSAHSYEVTVCSILSERTSS